MNYRTILTNLGVFLIGLALFMYEITLTRLFSTLLWYNYVFIIISLAMLGWTIGGIYSFRWLKKIKTPNTEKLAKRKVIILSLLSLTLWGAILFLYKVPYSSYLMPVYIVLSTLPFIFSGYYLSLSFKESAKKSNILYFADLLGSALGSVSIVLLLDSFSLIRIGVILGLIPLLAASFNLPLRKVKIPVSLMVAVIMVFTFTSSSFLDSWAQDFGAYKGNPKLLGSFEGKPRIVYTVWNSLARTDVVEENGGKNKAVLVDGGAVSNMIEFNGDLKTVEYLKRDVGYFPFAYKNNNSALLIGPGGGQDILYAKLGGVHNITAVEINPGSVEAAKKFKDFNGNIYGQDGTKVYVQDGRSFITRDQNKYDVIFLSKVMTQSSETLGYALSENYIYTKQAYEAYLNHLNPDGTLAFVLHSSSDLGKATATLLQIFEERGIPRDQAVKYMSVVNSTVTDGQMHGSNMIMYPLLMVKNTPFTQEQSQKIISLSQQSGQQIVSLPNEHEQLNSITPPANLQSTYLVTDNYPFFYNPGHTVPSQIIIMFLVVLICGYLLIRRSLSGLGNPLGYFKAYFAYIGLAFMLIEISLIQKLILLFGHPTLTFSAVIAILLFTAGFGSFFSKYLTARIPMKVIGATIFVYSILLFFILPWFISTLQGADITVKILGTLGLLLPQGLLMGIPFPTGLRLIEIQQKEDFIPVFWAINGWMSVVGSILALVLAMSFGYNVTLLAGALIYLVFAYHTRNLQKA